jgi:hypothetical protein
LFAWFFSRGGKGLAARLIPETIAPEFDNIVDLTFHGVQRMLSSAVAENAWCGALFLVPA